MSQKRARKRRNESGSQQPGDFHMTTSVVGLHHINGPHTRGECEVKEENKLKSCPEPAVRFKGIKFNPANVQQQKLEACTQDGTMEYR